MELKEILFYCFIVIVPLWIAVYLFNMFRRISLGNRLKSDPLAQMDTMSWVFMYQGSSEDD